MRVRTLLLLSLLACQRDATAVSGSEEHRSKPAAPASPALVLDVPGRVQLTIGKATTIHVEVPNRDTLESVLLVDAAQAPDGVAVEPASLRIGVSSVDVVVQVDADVVESTGSVLDLRLDSTRGTESVKHVVADIQRAPGSLESLTTYTKDTIVDPRAVSVASNGIIAMLGSDSSPSGVLRTSPTGKADLTFGLNGVADIELPDDPRAPNTVPYGGNVSVAPDGRVVVAGWIVDENTPSLPTARAFVKRMTPEGGPDDSFAFDPADRGAFWGQTADDAAHVVLAFRRDLDGPLDLYVLDDKGTVTKSASVPGLPPSLVSMSRDVAGGMRLAFVDGAVVAIHADLTPGSRVALGFAPDAMAVDATGRVILLHDNRIERWSAALDVVDPSFVAAQVTDVTWRALDVAPDGRIVAVGKNGHADTVLARFHP